MAKATPQPDQPAELDLDSWLDDITLPEEDVVVYARADLAAAYERLTNQLTTARSVDAAVGEEDRGIDHGHTADQLEAERERALEQLRASGRMFRLHGLTQQVSAQVREDARTPDGLINDETYTNVCMAAVSDLPLEQVLKLRDRLPLSEWLKLVQGMNRVLNRTVTLPFS